VGRGPLFFVAKEAFFSDVYGRVRPGQMKGIQFVVDDAGKKKAVLIDLAEWGEVWEDIYDVLVARSREDEPTIDWEVLKAKMAAGLMVRETHPTGT
jgi:hypothetical protein